VRQCQYVGARRWLRANVFALLMLLYVVVYVCVGVIFYTQHDGLSFSQALYYCLVIISTIGFGDISPANHPSRVFTFFYILGGFGFFTLILGTRINSLSSIERMESSKNLIQEVLGAAESTTAGVRKERKRRVLISFLKQSGIFAVLLAVGTLFYTQHNGYVFIEALYLSITIGSTVGTGDISPALRADLTETKGGIWFTIIYLIIFVTFTLNFLSWLSAQLFNYTLTHEVKSSMKGHLTQELLQAIDANQSGGIDKLEWLTAILVSHRIVSDNLVHIILKRFEELDLNKDDLLDEKDILSFTHELKAKDAAGVN